jgi:diacylglycerol kinase (ATP)
MEGSKTRTRVICNPASGGGCDPAAVRDALGELDIEWIDTRGPGDAREAAREWSEGLLIVVGGDGTVNEAVNGLGKSGFPEGVTLAVLPMGTGNDLAATLTVPDGIEEAEEVIRANRVRTLDVVRVRSEGVEERFFINVATGGFGAETSALAD